MSTTMAGKMPRPDPSLELSIREVGTLSNLG